MLKAIFFGACFTLPFFSFAQLEKIGSLSSPSSELKPLFSQDGNTLFFMRMGHPENMGGEKAGIDIWKAQRLGNAQFSTPANLGKPLNNLHHNILCGISQTQDRLLLQNQYLAGEEMKAGLSYADRKPDGSFSQAKSVDWLDVLEGVSVMDICFSTDGNTLIAGMAGAHDDEELFVAHFSWGKWSALENLSSSLNSDQDEISPFLSKDGRHLFFSSNRNSTNEKDFAVYWSARLDDTWRNWSTPKMLEGEIASDGFDAYFTLHPDGKSAYFVSDREGQEDVFYLPVASIVGFPELGIAPRELATATNNKLPSEGTSQASSQRDTIYIERVVEKEKVVMNAGEREEKKEKLLATYYFPYGTATLSRQQHKEIQALVKSQKEGQLLLKGYSSKSGDAKTNLRLSMLRANAVLWVLHENGYSLEQLSIRSLGESRAGESERKEDRRVEVWVRE